MWVCSGSALVAEICAGGGAQWLLLDMEHSPNESTDILAQLQAVAAYEATAVVRVPALDVVTIKRVLDLGAQNVLVPMVESGADARLAVEAVRYPPRGRRGVGSALARSARWNRIERYLAGADEHVALFVQIESAAGAAAVEDIAAQDGIDGIFVGPSDLAASMGLIGQQHHPRVVEEVRRIFSVALAAGVPVGVNAFDPDVADRYVEAGARFVLVAADVAVLARSSESVGQRWRDAPAQGRSSY